MTTPARASGAIVGREGGNVLRSRRIRGDAEYQTFSSRFEWISALVETAIDAIREHFAETEAEIALEVKPDRPGGTLFVLIRTALEIEDAMARFNAIDDAWFGSGHDVIRERLVITLEPI